MYAAEVFPQDFREVGMSWACSVNFAFAGALAMAVPQFTSSLDNKYINLLGAFAGLDALAAILVWLFMRSPEEATSLGDMNVRRHLGTFVASALTAHNYSSYSPPARKNGGLTRSKKLSHGYLK